MRFVLIANKTCPWIATDWDLPLDERNFNVGWQPPLLDKLNLANQNVSITFILPFSYNLWRSRPTFRMIRLTVNGRFDTCVVSLLLTMFDVLSRFDTS